MKIYESTEYIENRKVGDLKLTVISQWDFKRRSVCYSNIKSMGGNDLQIGYGLDKTVHVNEDGGGWRTEPVEDLTDEMCEELERLGYNLATPPTNIKEKL